MSKNQGLLPFHFNYSIWIFHTKLHTSKEKLSITENRNLAKFPTVENLKM